MSEPAYLLRGWPGHRNRQGSIGLDPLDTDFEQAHIQGTIIRKLFTLKFRTHNPYYLAIMILVGLFYCLTLLFVTPVSLMLFIQGDVNSIFNLVVYSPYYLIGLVIMINVFLSIITSKTEELEDDGSVFY